jgi:glycerophosphoryl diester phosphodiesterase
VAHRGSSAALPEHTIGAYQRAIDEGADGLECDVRLTRDGHLVCIHDGTLDRVSNGTGKVSVRSLAELDELDFGGWHPHPDGRPAAGLRTRVLTLDTLLSAAVDAGRPLHLFIETKHPTRYGGDVEAALTETLRRYGIDKPRPGGRITVTVMSFSALAVRRLRRLAPELDAVFLVERVWAGVSTGRLPYGAQILGPDLALVRVKPDLVRRQQERGHRVYVWTVNKPADVDLMLELGVDAVITDRPRQVLDHLGRCLPLS